MIYTKAVEILLAVALVCGAWFYAGHKAVSDYKKEVAIEQAKANAEQQARYDALAGDYEALKTKREADAKVIVRQVEKVVAGDAVYRNVCLNNSGLQLANSAIAGTATSKPDDTVQTAE